MTIEEIKRSLRRGKKTNSFLGYPPEAEKRTLAQDDYHRDSYPETCATESGADRTRSVFDNSKLLKPFQ